MYDVTADNLDLFLNFENIKPQNTKKRLVCTFFYFGCIFKRFLLRHIKAYTETKAIEFYDKAILLNPSNAEYYCNKGFSLSYLKEYKEAIENFNKAIELDPDNAADSYNNKGMALDKLKEFKLSKECYEKAIMIKPTEIKYQKNLRLSIKESKRFKK